MIRRLLGVALVLGLAGCGSDAPISAETRAREAYLRRLAEREQLTDAWQLMARSDLVFEDGFSLTQMIFSESDRRWTDVANPDVNGSVRGQPVRYMGANAHLRVRGHGDMHLVVWGHIEIRAIATRPRVTLTFDGLEVDSKIVDPEGRFAIETVIPGEWFHGWSDVYLNLSSIHEPWRSVRDLRVARLEGVLWEPVP